ncbi:diaminopimelate epimerase [Nevskia ramosa]|uniref:diaminopimelate epimerase n=2 Tax=Nevskia ramosa TaxID=64002 RepID=UPI0023520DAF|nr:diaminopimelate epimerase [Nevskia ramosa]
MDFAPALPPATPGAVTFTKMHGLGNDFVVIDATIQPFQPDAALLHRLTDRRFGIGCDQVLVVDPAPSAEVDFGYRIYNADGSQVGQCGNGARCLARFVADHGLSQKHALRVQTTSASLELRLLDNGEVTVDMGAPRFTPSAIPLAADARAAHYEATLADGSRVRFGAIGMGNPHAVIRVDDVDSAEVERIGPLLQAHALFPESVNVGFLQVIDATHARLRVYERGSGETLACGSGACAAFAVARSWGLLDSRAELSLRGGLLNLEWDGLDASPVLMTGPATTVFEGRFEWSI